VLLNIHAIKEEVLLFTTGHASCANMCVLCCSRDCERLVRSKLLARKLGYHPSHKQADSSHGSSGRGSGSMIEEMMLTAVMTAPEGLSSWQHRAAVEALIDQQLDLLVRNTGTDTDTRTLRTHIYRRTPGSALCCSGLVPASCDLAGMFRPFTHVGSTKVPGGHIYWSDSFMFDGTTVLTIMASFKKHPLCT